MLKIPVETALRDGPLVMMQGAGGRLTLLPHPSSKTIWKDKVPFLASCTAYFTVPVLISALSARD